MEADSNGHSGVNLYDICNKNPYDFGEVGSDRRRHIQILFGRYKKLTVKGYLNKLQDFTVCPGPATKHEFLASPDEQAENKGSGSIEKEGTEIIYDEVQEEDNEYRHEEYLKGDPEVDDISRDMGGMSMMEDATFETGSYGYHGSASAASSGARVSSSPARSMSGVTSIRTKKAMIQTPPRCPTSGAGGPAELDQLFASATATRRLTSNQQQQQFSPARQEFLLVPARQEQARPGWWDQRNNLPPALVAGGGGPHGLPLLDSRAESICQVLMRGDKDGCRPPTSESCPEIIVSMPEQNRPFLIQQTDRILVPGGSQKYDTVEIWLSTHPLDSQHQWTCLLHPQWNKVTMGEFGRLAIMVRGPSQDATFHNSGNYITVATQHSRNPKKDTKRQRMQSANSRIVSIPST